MTRKTCIISGLWALAFAALMLTPLDLLISTAAFRAGDASWSLGDQAIWKALYSYGVAPTLVLAAAAVITLVLCIDRAKCLQLQRASAYFLACLIVGPGILVNGLFKGLCGRPRPESLVEFGGSSSFEPLFFFDAASRGKSLACGHASMGFILFALVFLARRRRTRLICFGIALAAGSLIGTARILQGAHFFSDVFLAGAACWFTALGLARLMRLDNASPSVRNSARRLPCWGRNAIRFGVLTLLCSVLLATPREKSASFHPDFDQREIHLDLYGTVTLETDSSDGPGQLHTRVEGFGMPKSTITFSGSAGGADHRIKGFFTEMNARTSVILPRAGCGVRVLTFSSKLETLRIHPALRLSCPLTVHLPRESALLAPAGLPPGLTIQRSD